MRKCIILYIACLLTCNVFAQDAHHSQHFNLSPYYNPAAAGHDVEHIRLTGIYRRQWPSLATPFITQSILFDKQVSKVGFGALINKTSAGDGSMQRLQLGGMVSYRLKFNDHQFATGINIGFIQKTFDPVKMTFDDQYNDDIGYDPSNPTAEQFAFTKVVRPDFSAGFLYSYGDITKTRCVPYLGASMMHINQPAEVLIEQSNINPRKASVQGGMRFSCNEKVEIDPSVLIAMQQFSSEMIFGAKTVYKFDQRTKVEGGVYVRNKESIIAYAGYQWNSLMIGISYDAGISDAVSGPAAYELSLTYIPKAREKKEKKHKETPAATAKKPAPKKPEAKATTEKKTTTPAKQETKPAASSAKPNTKETKPVADKTQQKTTATPSGNKEKSAPAQAEKTTPVSNKTEKKTEAVKTEKTDKTKTETAKSTTQSKVEKEKPGTEVAKPEKQKTEIAKSPAQSKVEKEKPKAEAAKSEKQKTETAKAENKQPKAEAAKPAAKPEVKVTDGDNDGVPDVSDECPGIKGSAAAKGCPDADGDNIADKDDKCPNERGMMNNNGCPVKVEAPKMFDRVLLFEENSSIVERFDVIDILEPVGDILFFNKDAKLVISGYTYEEGDEKASMELSKERADAVKQFFVDNGFAPEKIETAGYGSAKPLAGTSSDETTRKNRRVEIQIIK